MRIKLLCIITITFITSCSFAQTIESNIITQDVRNFWEAVDSLKYNRDTVSVFQKLVIDRATDEFKIFINKWNITSSDYAQQISAFPEFYNSIRKNSQKLINQEDSIEIVVDKFRSIYPNFNSANICVAFGNFNTGGNVEITDDGNFVYIGLEYHGLDNATIITELPSVIQDYVSRSNYLRTVIHELVHIQQFSHGEKILQTYIGNGLHNVILREGIADFIANMIYPPGQKGNNYDYGIMNEIQLKEKLFKEIYNDDFSYWIYNSNTVNGQPRDLGYFMGYRIAENYYSLYMRKIDDITDLIEIEDARKFIQMSKYFDSN